MLYLLRCAAAGATLGASAVMAGLVSWAYAQSRIDKSDPVEHRGA